MSNFWNLLTLKKVKSLTELVRVRPYHGPLAVASGCLLAAICSAQGTLAWAEVEDQAHAAVPHTITLTKVVEVYEFEDLKVSVDQYQVGKGDSLVKLLKQRGLLTTGGRQEQAKLIRLVRSLNPDVKDLNNLTVGQTLKLPTPLAAEEPLGPPQAVETTSPPQAEATLTPKAATETVKVYERPQGGQQAAKVVVMRHHTNDEAAPPAAEAQATPTVEVKADGVAAQPAAEVKADGAAAQAAAEVKADGAAAQPAAEVKADGAAAQPAAEVKADGAAAQPTVEVKAAETSAPAAPASSQVSATSGGQAEAGPGGAGAPRNLDFPSGNAGPLAVESGSQVVYRTVKVQRGDTLERLLRREGMHRDLIYSQLLKVTLELNPDIKNQDLIFAGAEIRIPAAGDYLKTLAGVDPEEVITAAAAIHERRKPLGGGAGAGSRASVGAPTGERAAVLELPDEAAINAKNSLALLFSRLGERVVADGVREIPAGAENFELDTATFPIVELGGGRQLVLDPGSKLNKAAVRSLRAKNFQIVRLGRGESLERGLDKVWGLSGYYRVYKKDRTYEGGTDVRLKIAADWMVWPTQEAWNAGQPLVINKAKDAETRTSPAWIRFLGDHGLKIVDVFQNTILPEVPLAEVPAELTPIALTSRNTTFLAAELVKHLGAEPKVGVQLDLGKDQAAAGSGVTAPVLWTIGQDNIVLDFGEMPYDAAQTLRQNGYRLIVVASDNEAAIDGVLEGFGLKAKNELVISAPLGGPKMSLTLRGRLVERGGKNFFITNIALPKGLSLLIDPSITIMQY